MAKIIGNTTATPNPRPDWAQTDSTKADYIKNKPTILTEEEIAQLIVASAKVPTNIDFSAYDDGEIVETYADGSTKEYSFEFDADGNPVKITDSDGNVTVLTW